MRRLALIALFGVLSTGCSSGSAIPCSPDLTSDSNNCGACGKVCPADQECFVSACVGHMLPLPDPGGPPPDGLGTRAFAIKKIFLGDTDWNGMASPDAWKAFGYDIDRLFTTAKSTNVCDLAQGAPKSTQIDGSGGIDNSWGENVLPLYLTTAGEDFGTKLNLGILSGAPTTILTVDDLGNAPSASPMHASIVTTARFGSGGTGKWVLIGSKPKWDGTDLWPINAATLSRPDLASAKLDFPASYLNSGVLVAAPRSNAGVLTLGTVLGGVPFDFPVTRLMVAMAFSLDGTTVRGVLSAVIPVEPYIAYLKTLLEHVSPGNCDAGSQADWFLQIIRQAADILSDGSNHPGQPCDAISLGLGFLAEEVQLGAVVPPAVLPDPCATPVDAGTE